MARIEVRIFTGVHRSARPRVRKVRALPRRGDRHSSAHRAGSRQIACTGPNIRRTVHTRPAKLARRHAGDAVRHPSIAIYVGDVHIARDVHRAETVAVDSRAVPGAESLKRSQGYPANIAE